MMTTGNKETMVEKKASVAAGSPPSAGGSATAPAQVVTAIAPAKMTLAEVRERLDGKTGKRYWKNLDELAETPAFQELMQEEFPRQASGVSEWVDPVSRRGFMKVMGASMALAGLAGCTKQPDEPIYPYIRQPEDLILGKPMYFATAHPFPTGAIPVLVKSDAFRPIKIEGNPEHPMSRGKSDAITQATLLDMYDPDRSQHCLYRGSNTEWSYFQKNFADAVRKTGTGQGIYFLSETITSPTLAAQWKQVQAAYPQAKMVQWEPVNADSSRAASKAAFGEYVDAQYKLENADVILSLDADFLGGIQHPGFLPMAAAYAARHRFDKDKQMNRLYVIETMPTVTGFKAEHRLGLKPSDLELMAIGLAGGNAQGKLDSRGRIVLQVADQGSAGKPRQGRGDPGRAGVAGGACSRIRAEPDVRRRREHGGVHADRQSDAERAGRGFQVADRRHQRRQGAVAGDAWGEPDLLGAGGC